MDQQREREIALGLRKGDPEAWHALYDEFARPVWVSVARRLGPRHAEVADIVQETFMAAGRGARQYDAGRGSLWMWLSGIARNHVALYFRREKRHGDWHTVSDLAATAAGLLPWLEGRQAEPGAALEAAETAELVRATLAALPREYEILLVAKYIDEASLAQLAAAERSTPVALSSKLARARKASREAFLETSARPAGNEERETSARSPRNEERVR